MDDVLRVENISVSLGGFSLKDINIDLRRGEVLVILGRSGTGKTVLLETIAGFHKTRKGKIVVDGVDVTNFPPHRRRIGLVFQGYALFEHMSVEQNILFGVRYQRGSYDEMRYRNLVDMLNIEGLLSRYPRTLSAGEAQRVALARTLLPAPKVLLADEPFSALDAPLRERLRIEFLQTVKEMEQAVLFVTHDRGEAYTLGDRIAVMKNGEIIQDGRPDEVFYKPVSAEVAELVGVESLLRGVVRKSEEGLLEVDVAGVPVTVVGERDVGAEVTLCIRADRVVLSLSDDKSVSSMRNRFFGAVKRVRIEGPVAYVEVDCGFVLTAAVTRLSIEELNIEEGSRVCASFKAVAVHLF